MRALALAFVGMRQLVDQKGPLDKALISEVRSAGEAPWPLKQVLEAFFSSAGPSKSQKYPQICDFVS